MQTKHQNPSPQIQSEELGGCGKRAGEDTEKPSMQDISVDVTISLCCFVISAALQTLICHCRSVFIAMHIASLLLYEAQHQAQTLT